MNEMSEDAKVILLLCGHLGGEPAPPLSQSEYNKVVGWLQSKGLRPAALLSTDHTPILARDTGLNQDRLSALLKRGVKLGFAIEQWNQSGIWVICRSDALYPARYRSHLKEKAPPILFGAGDPSLLRGGGLAIVGSRDVDASGETFARDVAEQCAREGISVVSGGARGVDQVAMAGALDAGGTVLGVLADTLLRRSVSRDARDALASKRLVLVSPYNPEAGFNVGNAMGRNKLIYALADYGLVISSDYKKGGTWEGAQEELKRESGRPVFVRVGEGVPKGNLELTKMGARPFPEEYRTSGLSHFLEEASRKIPESVPVQPKGFVQPGLFSEPPTVEAPANQPFVAKESSSVQSSTAYVAMTILQAIKPVLVAALDKPRGLEELAKLLHVRKVQLQDWVKAFIADGTLEEQIKRKAKKLALRAPPASDRNQ